MSSTSWRRLVTGACIAVLSLSVSSSQAHHAFSAEFDSESPVQLTGEVTKIQWINPHAWFHFKVVNEDGSETKWMIEGGTPNALMRRGISRRSLPIGTEIVVQGYQSKDKKCQPACRANGRDMMFADGRKLFMGSSGTGAPEDGAESTR